jgi:hypothetical protein
LRRWMANDSGRRHDEGIVCEKLLRSQASGLRTCLPPTYSPGVQNTSDFS